jgi:hypothetical protein
MPMMTDNFGFVNYTLEGSVVPFGPLWRQKTCTSARRRGESCIRPLLSQGELKPGEHKVRPYEINP